MDVPHKGRPHDTHMWCCIVRQLVVEWIRDAIVSNNTIAEATSVSVKHTVRSAASVNL